MKVTLHLKGNITVEGSGLPTETMTFDFVLSLNWQVFEQAFGLLVRIGEYSSIDCGSLCSIMVSLPMWHVGFIISVLMIVVYTKLYQLAVMHP